VKRARSHASRGNFQAVLRPDESVQFHLASPATDAVFLHVFSQLPVQTRAIRFRAVAFCQRFHGDKPMCRFLAYTGSPIYLDTLLIEPESSLVSQSLSAHEAKTVVNGDGCGIGWYGARPRPGLYRGTLPAWSDANLASLCHQIEAPMFLAHVRSATSGEVSLANCHPFSHGRHLFMHNGQIGNYRLVRRAMEALIPDTVYDVRRGNGDSEAIFLIAAGLGLESRPVEAVGKALSLCHAAMREAGIEQALRFSAVLADGETIHAFRWASDARPPSLYWRTLATGTAIASEPFGAAKDEWTSVPPSTVMIASPYGISIEAFEPM
jgi:predicted glutamine amidotransferase